MPWSYHLLLLCPRLPHLIKICFYELHIFDTFSFYPYLQVTYILNRVLFRNQWNKVVQVSEISQHGAQGMSESQVNSRGKLQKLVFYVQRTILRRIQPKRWIPSLQQQRIWRQLQQRLQPRKLSGNLHDKSIQQLRTRRVQLWQALSRRQLPGFLHGLFSSFVLLLLPLRYDDVRKTLFQLLSLNLDFYHVAYFISYIKTDFISIDFSIEQSKHPLKAINIVINRNAKPLMNSKKDRQVIPS